MKVINIGSTNAEVIMYHAKKSLIYFVNNILKERFTLLPYQKKLIEKISKTEKET